jgi:hypothetical protein
MNMIGSLSVVLNRANFVLTSAGKLDVTPQPIVKQMTRPPTEARLVSNQDAHATIEETGSILPYTPCDNRIGLLKENSPATIYPSRTLSTHGDPGYAIAEVGSLGNVDRAGRIGEFLGLIK